MKKKCNACGHRFHPDKEKIYPAQNRQTVIEALSSAPQTFDMMDCPRCGCQVALAVRLPAMNTEESEDCEE